MFDDDIEHVRLQAMIILGKIAQGRVLRGEQVLSILTELLVCFAFDFEKKEKFGIFDRADRMTFDLHFMMSYELYVLVILRLCLNYFIA